jgi:hypothetical protein
MELFDFCEVEPGESFITPYSIDDIDRLGWFTKLINQSYTDNAVSLDDGELYHFSEDHPVVLNREE